MISLWQWQQVEVPVQELKTYLLYRLVFESTDSYNNRLISTFEVLVTQ